MKCQEVRALFFLYYDSALDPVRVQEVNLHIESCQACRALWKRETALEEALARAAWRAAGSTDGFPWKSCEEELRELQLPRPRGGIPNPPGVRPPGPGRPVARALVLALCLVLVATGAWVLLRPGSAMDVLTRDAVAHHEKYLEGRSLLQVESSDPLEVRALFSGELNFDVVVPGDSPSFKLLGARRCTFLGGPVPFVTFRGEEDVTVILGPSKVDGTFMEAISQSESGVLEESRGSHRVLAACVRGLLFTATGKVSSEELHGLLVAFKEESHRE